MGIFDNLDRNRYNRKKKNEDVYYTMGVNHYAIVDREQNDFYATDPKALELLLEKETFNKNVWECACGQGHLSEVLKKHGYNVKSTDLIDRGYGTGGINFLEQFDKWDGDIITNPPYIIATKFVEQSLYLIPTGNRVAMFLKLLFLESAERRKLFDENPPEVIYVASKRLNCAKYGDFEAYPSSAIAYAWFIWRKGFKGEPVVRWIN